MDSQHEGDERQFYQHSRAWWGKDVPLSNNTIEEINIGFYCPDGGTSGEFCIEWISLNNQNVPRLKAFEDSWSALWEFRDVLEKLAELDSTNPSPEEICELLKSCNVKDATPTENSYKKKEMNFNDYLKLACKTFPNKNYDKAKFSAPELLKNVAINLWFINDHNSQLAQETKKNLNHLMNFGTTLF